MRLLTPTVRMTPVMGVQDGRKVKEPGAAFVPFVMEPEQKAEEKRWIKDGITHIFSIGKYEERKITGCWWRLWKNCQLFLIYT